MNLRNLEEGHLKTLAAKYQQTLASGFREKIVEIVDARRRMTTAL